MPYKRPEHAIIAEALASMTSELLARCHCYFGGGTAIVLANCEYRLSLGLSVRLHFGRTNRDVVTPAPLLY